MCEDQHLLSLVLPLILMPYNPWKHFIKFNYSIMDFKKKFFLLNELNSSSRAIATIN